MFSYNKLVKKESKILDFKNYCNSKPNEKLGKENAQTFKSTQDFNKEAEDVIKKYSNYSNSQLMDELIKQTNLKKQNGSLDSQKLEQMYNTIYNVIPPENRKNLEDIFNRLK